MNKFIKLFKFDPVYSFYVGVERERFITDDQGFPIPKSAEVLALLPTDNRFGYELSACQLEDRVGPVQMADLAEALQNNDTEISQAVDCLGLKQRFMEVAPVDMDLTVYNDPSGRYQQIVKTLPSEILLAACRVAGTHVHIGMPDMETALAVYNQVIRFTHGLCDYINNTNGERLAIYKQMAKSWQPKPYSTIKEFYEDAVAQGFAKDPRKNWQLIRITIHGTIEFRMGGATASIKEVISFASACLKICQGAAHYAVTR